MSLSEGSKVNQRHLQILDGVIAGKGGSVIARELDMSPAQVSVIMNGPSFQHELALRRASVADKVDEKRASGLVTATDPVLEKLKKSALHAAERLSLNLTDQNGNVANKAADSILNRAGYPEKRHVDIDQRQLQIVISASDASLLAETLKMISV